MAKEPPKPAPLPTLNASDAPHLVGQQVLRIGYVGGDARPFPDIVVAESARLSLRPADQPGERGWRLVRTERDATGAWVADEGPGLRLAPGELERFPRAVVDAFHEGGFPAPPMSLAFLAEAYETDAEAGGVTATTLVPALVLRALALALAGGDHDRLLAMGRAALENVRVFQPQYVPLGDGDGLLERKGDDARNVGKDELLAAATRFCRNAQIDEDDLLAAAGELGFLVERMHPVPFGRAEAEAFRNPPTGAPADVHPLEWALRTALGKMSAPTPEAVARLALRTHGVSERQAAHYFEYRHRGFGTEGPEDVRATAGGHRVPSYVVHPSRANGAAVVVVPEFLMASEHALDVARRFARKGYLAVVAQLFHRHGHPALPIEPSPRRVAASERPSPEDVTEDLRTVVAWLKAHQKIEPSRVALVGFEAGGAVALSVVTAGTLATGAVVAVSSAYRDPVHTSTTPVLCILGDEDPIFVAARRAPIAAALAARGDASRLIVLPRVCRGFFDPNRRGRNREPEIFTPAPHEDGSFDLRLPRFHDRRAAEATWTEMLAFLGETVGRGAVKASPQLPG